MSESFVDLSYRGLSLGRRIKLTRVQAASGYLETPAPMPVGTAIAIATDEGLTLEAIVTQVHEQVGGTTTAPGMEVAPALAGEATAWWTARIEPPKVEEPAPVEIIDAPPTAPMVAPRAERVTVRPRSHTVPAPPPEGALADLGAAAAAVAAAMTPPEAPVHPSNDHGATTAMAAVDLAALGLEEPGTRSTGQHAIIDDGKRTTVMDAIDPAALGLEVTESGRFVAATEETTDVGAPPVAEDKKPAGGTKKRRKRKG